MLAIPSTNRLLSRRADTKITSDRLGSSLMEWNFMMAPSHKKHEVIYWLTNYRTDHGSCTSVHAPNSRITAQNKSSQFVLHSSSPERQRCLVYHYPLFHLKTTSNDWLSTEPKPDQADTHCVTLPAAYRRNRMRYEPTLLIRQPTTGRMQLLI